MQIQIYIHIYVDYRWELWKMSAKRKKTKGKNAKKIHQTHNKYIKTYYWNEG